MYHLIWNFQNKTKILDDWEIIEMEDIERKSVNRGIAPKLL